MLDAVTLRSCYNTRRNLGHATCVLFDVYFAGFIFFDFLKNMFDTKILLNEMIHFNIKQREFLSA